MSGDAPRVLTYDLSGSPEESHVWLDGRDVSGEIRTPEIGELSSRLAAQPAVRRTLQQVQRGLRDRGPLVAEGRDLRGDGLDDRGVRVAERVDGDAADEVEVLVAVGVPHLGAGAAHEWEPGGAVVVHERALPAGGELLVAGHSESPSSLSETASSGTTIVPIPSFVKISSRMECWTRPSMTRASPMTRG